MTNSEIIAKLKSDNAQSIMLQFSDLHGIAKSFTIPVSKADDALASGIWFDGSSIVGFTRIAESDMYLKPDIATFAVIPWTVGTDTVSARIICDVYMPDGSPFEGDPRYILKKQIKKAEEAGYSYYVGPELEFFLFKKVNGKVETLPHDYAGYFDQSMDLADEIRNQMSLNMEEFGLDVEALHHEVAVGQHEIDFKYNDALVQADSVMTFKLVVKSIAKKYDLHASFMAKPVAGINGSGMHCNQSLFKDGENAFYDAASPDGLSAIARNFVAGQL